MDDFFNVRTLPTAAENQSTNLENDLLDSTNFSVVNEASNSQTFNDRDENLLDGFGLSSMDSKLDVNLQSHSLIQSKSGESGPESFDILSLGDVPADDSMAMTKTTKSNHETSAANSEPTTVSELTFSPDSFDILSFEGDTPESTESHAPTSDKNTVNIDVNNVDESSLESQGFAAMDTIFSQGPIQQIPVDSPIENLKTKAQMSSDIFLDGSSDLKDPPPHVFASVTVMTSQNSSTVGGHYNAAMSSSVTDTRGRTSIKGPINEDIYTVVGKDPRREQQWRDTESIPISTGQALPQSDPNINEFSVMSVGAQSGSLNFASMNQNESNQTIPTTLNLGDGFQQASTPVNTPTFVIDQEAVADNAMGAVDQFLEEIERKKFEPEKENPHLDLNDVIAKSTTSVDPPTLNAISDSDASPGGLKKVNKASTRKKKVSFADAPEKQISKKLKSPEPINERNSGGPRITMPEFSDAWEFKEVDDGKSDFIPTTNLE